MSTRQTVAAAIILALVCCGVMWLLEDFRQRKMLAELRGWLDTIPTTEGGSGQ